LFPCMAVSCNRSGRKPFTRIDKFREHVRNHGEETLFNCPTKDCSAGMFSLTSLIIHCSVAHCWKPVSTAPYSASKYERFGQPVAAIWKSAWTQKLCPLQGCRKPFKGIFKLQPHLKEHEQRDVVAQRSSVEMAGFNPVSCAIKCLICLTDINCTTEHELLGHVYHHFVNKTHKETLEDTFGTDSAEKLIPSRRLMTSKDFNFKCPACAYRTTRFERSYSFYDPYVDPFHKELWVETETLHSHLTALFQMSPHLYKNSMTIFSLFPLKSGSTEVS
jgi:hypothetical protein